MKQELLSMQNIYMKQYETYTLNDFNLDLFRGQFVHIMGLSGAGKTALFDYFTGNVSIDSGFVYFAGKRYEKGMLLKDNKHIVCLGKISTLIENASVMENLFLLSSGQRTKGIIHRKELDVRARIILSKYAPDIDAHSRIRDLNEGQKRRIELIRAIDCDAKLVVIDDVFTGCDSNELSKLIALIYQMKHMKISILYESQQLDFAYYSVADQFVVMRDGKKYEDHLPRGLQRKDFTKNHGW